MRILMISFQELNEFAHGGVKGTIKNYKALSSFGNVDLYSVKKSNTLLSMLSLVEGNISPVLFKHIKEVMKLYKEWKYDFVFLDHSALGIFAKKLKTAFPECKVVTTYRNCELDYIDVRFEKSQKFRKWIFKRRVKKAEEAGTKYADVRVVLTQRDQTRIEELYGIKPEIIIPQSMDDVFNATDLLPEEEHKKQVLLFGPAGSANLEAFSWFVDNISPYINATTVIAGKGMDAQKERFAHEYTEVIGYVNDIGKMYASVDCVVIPLKKGGGMKFKTAEAMMFGKYIFGTREAFEGYDIDMTSFSEEYEEPNDYITAINSFLRDNRRFYQASRDCFLENYSNEGNQKRYKQIIDTILRTEV